MSALSKTWWRGLMPDMSGHKSKRTIRLTGTYLAIIMTMTVVFSVVMYQVVSREFNHPPQRDHQLDMTHDDDIDALFAARADHAKEQLIIGLVGIDLVTLLLGAVVSYMLARATLQPIEDALDAQSQFVSDASHELRTPITALQVTNEVALRNRSLNLAQARELIGHNVAEAARLQQLSNELLTLLKAGRSTRVRTKINLQPIVAACVQAFDALASERDVQIVSDTTDKSMIMSNEGALRQILGILVDNAIKYSPSGGKVAIRYETHRKHIKVIVEDQGPGIAEADQAKIFTRFYRTDSARTRQKTHGHGLGLAIAAALCRELDIRIGVVSKPGEGASFWLSIPR